MTAPSPPPIVVDLTWQGGMRFAARSDAAEFILDGPGNSVPTPVQALAGSLAACMGIDLVQILTKGAKVKIPSESRLEFTLKQPLAVQ